MISALLRPAIRLVIVLSLTLVASQAFAAKRVALVVGNDDYRHIPKLQKAVADARTMGDTLRQLGFQVLIAENQTRQSFSETLLAFDRALEKGDTAFFFYAGHGFEIAGQNFLLPTDVPAATSGQEELVRDSSIMTERVVSRLQNRGVRTAILVLDACRNNPFEQRWGTRSVGGGSGLAGMLDLPEGMFTLFSAGPKQAALDRLSDTDTNPNSVFTRVFAKELLQPGLTLVDIAYNTRKTVNELATSVKHKQIPTIFDQMADKVYFNGGPEAKRAVGIEPQVAALNPGLDPGIAPRTAPQPESSNAPIALFSRHNGGWTIVFSIIDPALAISWRYGESGEFKETGFMDTLDPRTRKRMPNSSIELPSDSPAATLQVRYIDAQGEVQGPFPIKFDPEAALIRDQRRTLDLTSTSWLSFREFNGLLVYYTHLMSFRCAIREVKVGIDSSVPDQVIKMPPCDPLNPSSIPHEARPYMKLPPATKSVSVELTYRDGTTSEIKSFRKAAAEGLNR